MPSCLCERSAAVPGLLRFPRKDMLEQIRLIRYKSICAGSVLYPEPFCLHFQPKPKEQGTTLLLHRLAKTKHMPKRRERYSRLSKPFSLVYRRYFLPFACCWTEIMASNRFFCT